MIVIVFFLFFYSFFISLFNLCVAFSFLTFSYHLISDHWNKLDPENAQLFLAQIRRRGLLFIIPYYDESSCFCRQSDRLAKSQIYF